MLLMFHLMLCFNQLWLYKAHKESLFRSHKAKFCDVTTYFIFFSFFSSLWNVKFLLCSCSAIIFWPSFVEKLLKWKFQFSMNLKLNKCFTNFNSKNERWMINSIHLLVCGHEEWNQMGKNLLKKRAKCFVKL